MIKQTQKQRLEEAYKIHSRFHNWMGFLVCDGEEDMLALRKLVKKLQMEERNRILKIIDKSFNRQRKTTWDEDEEHSSNPIHQSDFIAWHKELKQEARHSSNA